MPLTQPPDRKNDQNSTKVLVGGHGRLPNGLHRLLLLMSSGKDLILNSIFRVGLVLAIILLPPRPAEATQTYCESKVRERLDRLYVSPSNIREIYYEAQHHISRKTDRRIGFLAWVSLQSCRGYLVIDMSRQCTFRQVFGLGGCDLNGAVETW